MRKRKPDNPSPATLQGDKLAAIPHDPPPARHGPAGPARTLYGLAHLRAVLNLSDTAALDEVCEDAACELEHLRDPAPGRPWTNRSNKLE